ncbi:hypothetical protein [Ectopseudomonas oleovorans]|uniref:hypothetical protein n=1 Tax=Ectopseudomonas oleovorans TaxID=301 RepID=UPI0011C07F99|nr:hypothetical protein [Pseudomonas oleovorans]
MPQPIAVVDPDAPGTLRLSASQAGLDGLEINGRIDWQGATAPVLERVFYGWNPDWKKGSVSARDHSLSW